MSEEQESTSAGRSNVDSEDKVEDDQAKVQESIVKLRTLIVEEKKLRVRNDDHFLLRFLRSSELDAEKAFEKLVKFYKFKAKNKEYFCSEPASEYRDLLSQNFCTLLEDSDQHGRRVFLAKMAEIDFDSTTVKQCIKINDLWMELALEEDETQKNGFVMILDLGGLPLRLVKFLHPKATITSTLKTEMRPWSNFEVHVVNYNALVSTLVNLLFPLLTTKMKEQIHFHGKDWGSLHKFITPEVLPQEYGGQKSTIDYQKMQQYVYDNEEKLLELCSLGYIDEGK
ncbi:clavesin-2-like [Periplaneta americana]|uniref:clavesin-2-like n=1 Tax=Periplaneta americana TaxID=6978 RepID=UPI0037E7BC42